MLGRSCKGRKMQGDRVTRQRSQNHGMADWQDWHFEKGNPRRLPSCQPVTQQSCRKPHSPSTQKEYGTAVKHGSQNKGSHVICTEQGWGIVKCTAAGTAAR